MATGTKHDGVGHSAAYFGHNRIEATDLGQTRGILHVLLEVGGFPGATLCEGTETELTKLVVSPDIDLVVLD
jgi:hypothetical protein